MHSSAWGGVTREELTQTVALLHMLNKTPEQSLENSLDEYIKQNDDSSARVLSPKHEKLLVEMLAFLAAWSDDPRKVVALCVEEGQDQRGLIIRLAVNWGDLQRVKDCFERIARILQSTGELSRWPFILWSAPDRPVLIGNLPDREQSEKARSSLLREAVALNHNRILCRLRSRHARYQCNFKKSKQLKPKIVPQLVETVAEYSASKLTESVTKSAFAILRADIEKLRALFIDLEAMPKSHANSQLGRKVLIDIVELIHQVHCRDTLNSVIDSSSRGGCAPESSLSMAIVKLSRYRTASDLLVQAAKTLPIFANIQIRVVKLLPPPQLKITGSDTFITGIGGRLFDETRDGKGATHLTSHLQKSISQSLADVASVVHSRASSKHPVHAEIQLLFYYEINHPDSFPRVISSTKKACFLCNLFFKLHGTFFLPSTHGRLYEKWALPERMNELWGARGKRMGTILSQFSKAIEDALRCVLQTGRKSYPHPNESAFFASVVWSVLAQSEIDLSTAVISQPSLMKEPDEARQGVVNTPIVLQQKSSDMDMTVATTTLSDITPPLNLADTSRGSSTRLLDSILTSPNLPRVTKHADEAVSPVFAESVENLAWKYFPLRRGEHLSRELSAAGQPLRVGTRQIHLTLSYDGFTKRKIASQVSPMSSEVRGRCWVVLRWLMLNEPPKTSRRGLNVVALKNLAKGLDLVIEQGATNASTELYVYEGQDMISIQYHLYQ